MVLGSLRLEFSGHFFEVRNRFFVEIRKSGLAFASGLLLTAAFPRLGLDWTAWFALLPLLIAVRTGGFKEIFRLGLIAGLVHYLTLVYWLAYTMRTYGYLPWIVCIPVLFLLAFVLGLFVAAFCAALPATALSNSFPV